ncbi:MAG: ATP-binding protein [Syntrophobacteraceae bacterium]
MTPLEVRQLITDIQLHQSELDNLEVKTARGGTPKRLYEALSAFANRPGGGVILFGLSESSDFSVVGVGDAHRLQEEITHVASADMEPALRPQFLVDEIDGETIVSVEIDEIPPAQKPCFYKPSGLPKGAFIRVGNTNRQMTEYEVFGYLSGRGQPTYDEEVVAEATLKDLGDTLVDDYLARLRKTRPRADFLNLPQEEVLSRLHVLRHDGEVLRPTVSGLLMFGKYPQEFFPQLMITFVQYYGTKEEEKTPAGARFLDNRRFEGPIPEMVEEAERHVMAAMRKASLIVGLFRQEVPEYPQEAFREAISNAIAHRDYSPYVRGSYIQIRMFADRLEVQSPGGLYGNVSIDNLEEEHSTRNARLMRMMEDMHIVENRGSGIKAMLQAMREANLEPPRFDDKRSSFRVSFHNHTLLNPDAIEWLSQFAGATLNDRQRLALVYMRQHGEINNRDYRRLNRVDVMTAGHELRGLVESRLTEQSGFGRWTIYKLRVPSERLQPPPVQGAEDKVLTFVREHGSINNAECRGVLGIDRGRAKYLLGKMVAEGVLVRYGERRWARFRLP